MYIPFKLSAQISTTGLFCGKRRVTIITPRKCTRPLATLGILSSWDFLELLYSISKIIFRSPRTVWLISQKLPGERS